MTINAVTDAVLTIDPATLLYDINIDAQGDIETADFFDTSILYSIFGERRANKDEVLDARYRRGWIGSEGKDFENGSKVWLFEQSRITATNLARIADEVKKSLQWLVDDGLAVSLIVESVTVDTKRNKLVLTLDIRRSADKVERRFFDLWDNTGKPRVFKESVVFSPRDLIGMVLWLDSADSSSVIESGGPGTGVSQWNDNSGKGHHLKQSVGVDRPSLEAGGSILFDGVSQFLKADAFTLVQPETIYIVFQQLSFTFLDTIYDGNTENSGVLSQLAPTPNISFQVGANFLGIITSLPLGVYGVIITVVNGPSSVLQLNNKTPITGDTGTIDMNGFTLAKKPGIGRFGNIQVKEVIIYDTAHDVSERNTVIAYLINKWAISFA